MWNKKYPQTTYLSSYANFVLVTVYIFYICLSSFCQELTFKYMWKLDSFVKLFVKFFGGERELFDAKVMITYSNK